LGPVPRVLALLMEPVVDGPEAPRLAPGLLGVATSSRPCAGVVLFASSLAVGCIAVGLSGSTALAFGVVSAG